jgi:hypothetical protein
MALGRLFNIPKEPNLHITNDIDLLASAMLKHLELKTEIVLLAGTGSVAMSYKIKTGVPVRTARSGGWGWILGDGGSGFDLGRKGVQATLSAIEEARIPRSSSDPATNGALKPFHLDIMKSLGVPEEWITFDVLSHILNGNLESFDDLKSKIAGAALIVLNAASSDLEAIQIMNSGSEALVSHLVPIGSTCMCNTREIGAHLSWGTYEKSIVQRSCLAEVGRRGCTLSDRRNHRRCFYFWRRVVENSSMNFGLVGMYYFRIQPFLAFPIPSRQGQSVILASIYNYVQQYDGMP